MTETLEKTAIAERDRGYFPHLSMTRTGWKCDLLCGVDVLPANLPRPSAEGETAEAALLSARSVRDRMVGR